MKQIKPPCLSQFKALLQIPNSVLEYYLDKKKIQAESFQTLQMSIYTNHIATKACTAQYIAKQPMGHNQTQLPQKTQLQIYVLSGTAPRAAMLGARDRIGPVASKATPHSYTGLASKKMMI
uniref:Uncharacterized protein n=1 Tax=Zea mays TaxID=4577 RepID=C4J6J1_MAIZE|nr:unknown [Zea mays]